MDASCAEVLPAVRPPCDARILRHPDRIGCLALAYLFWSPVCSRHRSRSRRLAACERWPPGPWTVRHHNVDHNRAITWGYARGNESWDPAKNAGRAQVARVAARDPGLW